MKHLLSLKTFDEALDKFVEPSGNSQVDQFCHASANILRLFRDSQETIIEELLTMYNSASEHNVDISREAIYQLAKRLKG